MEHIEVKKVCRCGNAIIKQTWETIKQFERREKAGVCRSKCKKLPRAKNAFDTFTAPIGSVPSERLLEIFKAGGGRPSFEKEFVGSFFKVVSEEDPKYLKFIRSLPCVIPGCGRRSEAHHQNPEGHGQKGATCSDRRALPICSCHHTMGGTPEAPGSYHGQARLTGRAFLAHYGIDPEKKILQLNHQYEEALHNG